MKKTLVHGREVFYTDDDQLAKYLALIEEMMADNAVKKE